MSLFAQARVVESPPVIIVSGIVSVEGKIRDEYPLVQSRCHYNIVDVYSIAELVQDYHSSAPVSRDVEYVFPLPPGGAVCSFKAVIDEKKVIKGVVKEKATAKAQYQEAVAQGKTAGLLEQEHADAPTTVPWFVANTHNRFDLTVAIQMNKPVTSVSSPSHPIGLTLGCNERELKGEYEPCKAFVSLGASTFLDSDIVIVISAQGLETPRCSVERWFASEGAEETTDAYAFTFVPKFDLPALPSQVDRSGSMWGGRMDSVKASLQIMLRSLPSENTTFNIVSFGDKYTTMWPNSQPYSAESVEEASKQVDTFKADYGGTELRSAIDFSFRNRVSASSSFKDKTPTAVFVLTD
ncbi:10641_t:CDS:2, partial [Acaulospora colombiana]